MLHHHHTDNCNHDHEHQDKNHIPRRKILTKDDLESFQSSMPFSKFIGFIERLNHEITDLPLEKIRKKYLDGDEKRYEKDGLFVEGGIGILCQLLENLRSWVDKVPAHEMGLSRFGNPGFRDWYDMVQEKMDESLMPLLANKQQREEAGAYLLASFGDRKRIDYGTGHEANFICFLLCLCEFKAVSEDEYDGLVAVAFWEYAHFDIYSVSTLIICHSSRLATSSS
jgi:serine/threonine-protein phosphatase 2A activator